MSPNKKFGQNFLCGNGVIDRIIKIASVNKDDNILEIGPGLGGLTEKLIEKAGLVTAVEIDSGFVEYLNQKFYNSDNLKIIHSDFLKQNLSDNFTKVISNLPYSFSSAILFNIIEKYHIKELYIMLQKEMADRIISSPGTKKYGALTITLGLYYRPELLFNIDKRSFYPHPDCLSSFLRLTYREDSDLASGEVDLFHRIVRSAFWGRRKMLIKTLTESPHLNLDSNMLLNVFRELNIDDRVRGERLGLEQFKVLAKKVYEYQNMTPPSC